MNNSINNLSNNSRKNIINSQLFNSVKENYIINYNNVNNNIKQIPLNTRILYIFIIFTLMYIFTYFRYNLILSIFFAIILFILFFLTNKMYGLIFIILYIIVISRITQEKNHTLGVPIHITDIKKNKTAYDCTKGGVVIQGNTLPGDQYGGHYTYSFWIYLNGNTNDINDGINWISYRYNEWKSIFYRGNPIEKNGDLSSLVQYPGFWLTPILNNMVIVFQGIDLVERIEIDNIPFNSWVNFTVVLNLSSISVYMDGLLNRTLNLEQTSKIVNNYSLFITDDKILSNENISGFAGYLGELICFNYSLDSLQIYTLYSYYKKILDSYQLRIIKKKSNYKIPRLITNSDYF